MIMISITAPGGRSGQIIDIFEITGGAGDIDNSTSMPNYCDEPYGDLGMYVTKVVSAWTKAWTDAWPSRAAIMGPGGRSGQILQFTCFWEGLVVSRSH